MLVLKFGGTSVQSAEAMSQVIEIVASQTKPCLVVSSACAGVTNLLLELADLAVENRSDEIQTKIQALRERHFVLSQKLVGENSGNLLKRIGELCNELARLCEGIGFLRECTPRTRAMLLSFGERLSTEILTAGFQNAGHSAELLDARTVLRTDGNFLLASAQIERVSALAERHILPLIQEGKIVVTQGFIGSNEQGLTTVLGRGGSDLSAAIFGAALNSEEIQIWTDVSGIFTADPRIVPNADTISVMTFAEAGELAYFGAKVLHPDTVRPAIEKNIPVRILNTFKPENAGTLLTNEAPSDGSTRAVTIKKDCVLVKFQVKPQEEKTKFLASLFAEMSQLGLETLAFEGAERHCSLCFAFSEKIQFLQEKLADFADSTSENVAILCASAPPPAGKFLTYYEENPIATLAKAIEPFKPYFLQYSANKIAIISAVPEHLADDALRVAHSVIGKR